MLETRRAADASIQHSAQAAKAQMKRVRSSLNSIVNVHVEELRHQTASRTRVIYNEFPAKESKSSHSSSAAGGAWAAVSHPSNRWQT
jgi:hypothetical protein